MVYSAKWSLLALVLFLSLNVTAVAQNRPEPHLMLKGQNRNLQEGNRPSLIEFIRQWVRSLLNSLAGNNPVDSPTPVPTNPVPTPPERTTPSPISPPTPSPTKTVTLPASDGDHCSCTSCTDEVWNTLADGETCGDRIVWLQTELSAFYPSEFSACSRVAEVEFPSQCGKCNPNTCDGRTPPPPPDFYCGCADTCTDEVWNANADGATCGERITWVQQNVIPSMEGACRRVAIEFPTLCGPACNPDSCNPSAPRPGPIFFDDSVGLYCFPDQNQRVEYTWLNKYTVQVKESNAVCGPGNNMFGPETVALLGNDLKLQFKRVNNVWQGSEVRVLLPNAEMPYTYGTYSFSVKSVSHRNSGGAEISKALPPSLVLGLFTWDPTDDYSIRQNFNKEVDIEISQWGNPNAMDLQFLVQPPGEPQMERFYTGPGTTLDQGGHVYDFTWIPGEVKWSTDANGGRRHSYATRDTVINQRPDYVQCLPANVEVRLNLWNMDDSGEPMNMNRDDVVEVIIDNFTYTPSPRTGILDGNFCTKSCQCKESSYCNVNNLCMPRPT